MHKQKMNFIHLLFVLFAVIGRRIVHSLIDETSCPIGWQIASDLCVQVQISPATLKHAKKRCHLEGGDLLAPSSNLVMEDVFDILKGLEDNGLSEPIFHIGGMGQALNRSDDGKYRIIPINALSAHPFICSLSKMRRRALLFQQKLLELGAPRITSRTPSEIYFHPRLDADFIALPCNVDGDPKPVISWFRNDMQVISPSVSNVTYLLSGGSLLVPASASLAYSSFHCTARNSLGEIRSPSILLKPSFIEAFRQHRLDVYSLMNGGAKLDCDAPAHQPKSLTYSWLFGSTTDRIVSQNERIFISLDGTLFFSYVLPEDEDSYACSLSVYSTQSGNYGPFFRLVSSTPNSTLTNFQPRLDSTQPQLFPEHPKIGDSIYLECFAYAKPLPKYKWSRLDGKPLPAKAQFSNHGRVLKLDDATYADAGKYKCVASNSVGAAAGEVNVKLRAPPTILQKLHDRLVSSGSDVDFECILSNSDSFSSVEWFKDAKPIVPLLLPIEKRRRLKIEENVLKIRNTEESDSGVYQCIVSNEIGSSSSSALLKVKDSPPIFPPNAMPRRVFAAIGSAVRIPCIFEASPRHAGKWADAGGAGLPNRGRIRDEDGTITIENVQLDDAGLFFCTALNNLGKAHSQVQLVVMNKPSIRTNAASNYIDEEETVNMSCEVELSCGNSAECPETLFEWKINNRPSSQYPLLRPKIHEHQTRTIGQIGKHIKQKVDLEVPKSLGGNHIGRFACSSIYGGSSEVLTRAQLPSPIAVSIEHLREKRGKRYRLKWRLPPQHRDTRDHSPKVEGYLVEVRTKRDRKWRAAERGIVSNAEKDSIIVSNLLPNSDYQFRVRSVEVSNVGDPSTPSEWIRTPPGPPMETIDSLKWRSLDSRTLLVEWKPIEIGRQPSGNNLRYRVSWTESTIMNRTENEDSMSNFVDSKNPQAVLRLNSSEGCRMVVLAVRPINDQGNGAVSTDTIAFLNSNGELKRVSMHNVKPINASHVNISWVWDRDSECDTKHAVQISCRHLEKELSITVANDRSFWVLGGLDAETAYDCNLRAVDNHGNHGPPSRNFKIHTKQHPPIVAPTISKLLMKQMKDGYTTILEWSMIQLQNANKSETGCGYKIYIYISETATEPIELDMPVQRLSDRRFPSARLDGLKLMYMYTIKVAGYNPGGVGPISQAKSIRLGSHGSMELSSNSLQFPFYIAIIIPFYRFLRF